MLSVVFPTARQLDWILKPFLGFFFALFRTRLVAALPDPDPNPKPTLILTFTLTPSLSLTVPYYL